MSRLALAAVAAVGVYGIGLTALALRRWPAPPALTRMQRIETMDVNAQLERLQHACPDCACCTAELCRRAAESLRGCQAHTAEKLEEWVAACPCSARAIASAAAAGGWNTSRVGGPDPAPSVVATSVEPGFLAGFGAASPAGFVAVRQVTTTTAAVFMVQQAGVVRVAGGEPW